jgi:glycosyltransferase involved in cell wall biosynthesis
MKVAHITPSFWPAEAYGGATESTYQLCRHLSQRGCRVRVLTTNADGRNSTIDVATESEIDADAFRIRYCARRIGESVSPQYLRQLPGLIQWCDVVHLTGVYSFPTLPTLLFCRLFHKPIMWSPRGALQRWDGSTSPAAKAVWEGLCRTLLSDRAALHVTSPQEEEASRRRLPGHRVCMVPNGVVVPTRIEHAADGAALRLLYLGRLDPKKGIENLFAACSLLRERGPSWVLTVAGKGEKQYTLSLQNLVADLHLGDVVRLVGHVSGVAKERVFAEADVVVVPSHTENFGMVVAEALARGVPVIASTGTPWARLSEMKCGLWVDNKPASLASAIMTMGCMSRVEMGLRGREWMSNEFAWSDRASQMIRGYEELIGHVA